MTRGEAMLALRKKRMAQSPPILRGGFRLFFFGGALWAMLAIGLWIGALDGGLTIPSVFDPVAWHRHAMLFGFVGAIISGFALTAIPNWTGRLPIAGLPLASLFTLWMAARIAVLFSSSVGLVPAALLDAGFYFVFGGLAAREIRGAKNRNMPVVLIILLFGLVDLCDYGAVAGFIQDPLLPSQLAITLIVVLISLMGGRIVPSFTRNWLVKQGVREGLPGQPGRWDIATIAITGAALLLWATLPEWRLTAAALTVAAICQAARLIGWKGYLCWREPIVLILHIGYAWIPAGLLLLGLSMLGVAPPVTAGIHALTAGAMATMILAVMTRATLGHTGRELRAGRATVAIYALVTIGAIVRVTAAYGAIDFRFGIHVAGLFWAGAFALFAIAYGPIFFAPRLGEK